MIAKSSYAFTQLSSQYACTYKISEHTKLHYPTTPFLLPLLQKIFFALVLTTDRDIIHVMCKSAANFLLLFMSHLLLAWLVMNVTEQPFSYNLKELANMR